MSGDSNISGSMSANRVPADAFATERGFIRTKTTEYETKTRGLQSSTSPRLTPAGEGWGLGPRREAHRRARLAGEAEAQGGDRPMSEPIPVVVKRWKCPHCSRSRAHRAATEAHIDRCWLNPDNRTCKTCAHFEPVRCCGLPDLYGCYTPMCPDLPTCAAGVQLPDPERGSKELEFVTGCPRWRSADKPAGDLEPTSRS